MSHPIRPSLTLGTNSYVTKANADQYFANRFSHAAWDALSDEDDVRALITASAQISRAVKSDYGLPFVGAIPQLLQDATCELALAMANSPAIVEQANTSKNIKRVKAGPTDVEFFAGGSGSSNGSRFPPPVMEILNAGDFMSTSGLTAPFVSGSGCTSSFDDADVYSRTESFK